MNEAPTCSICRTLTQNTERMKGHRWVKVQGQDGLTHYCLVEPGGTVGFAALCGCIPSAPLGP